MIAELEQARGANAALDRAIADVKEHIAHPADKSGARRLAEVLALALQADGFINGCAELCV